MLSLLLTFHTALSDPEYPFHSWGFFPLSKSELELSTDRDAKSVSFYSAGSPPSGLYKGAAIADVRVRNGELNDYFAARVNAAAGQNSYDVEIFNFYEDPEKGLVHLLLFNCTDQVKEQGGTKAMQDDCKAEPRFQKTKWSIQTVKHVTKGDVDQIHIQLQGTVTTTRKEKKKGLCFWRCTRNKKVTTETNPLIILSRDTADEDIGNEDYTQVWESKWDSAFSKKLVSHYVPTKDLVESSESDEETVSIDVSDRPGTVDAFKPKNKATLDLNKLLQDVQDKTEENGHVSFKFADFIDDFDKENNKTEDPSTGREVFDPDIIGAVKDGVVKYLASTDLNIFTFATGIMFGTTNAIVLEELAKLGAAVGSAALDEFIEELENNTKSEQMTEIISVVKTIKKVVKINEEGNVSLDDDELQIAITEMREEVVKAANKLLEKADPEGIFFNRNVDAILGSMLSIFERKHTPMDLAVLFLTKTVNVTSAVTAAGSLLGAHMNVNPHTLFPIIENALNGRLPSLEQVFKVFGLTEGERPLNTVVKVLVDKEADIHSIFAGEDGSLQKLFNLLASVVTKLVPQFAKAIEKIQEVVEAIQKGLFGDNEAGTIVSGMRLFKKLFSIVDLEIGLLDDAASIADEVLEEAEQTNRRNGDYHMTGGRVQEEKYAWEIAQGHWTVLHTKANELKRNMDATKYRSKMFNSIPDVSIPVWKLQAAADRLPHRRLKLKEALQMHI